MKQLTLTIVLATILTTALNAQIKYHASYTSVSIAGTSTLHDWDMTSQKANCDIALNFDGVNITSLSSLVFTADAESLKSHHSGMDKNAYKALNSDKYPEISFASSYANIRPNGTNSYLISAKGKLTIAGVSERPPGPTGPHIRNFDPRKSRQLPAVTECDIRIAGGLRCGR